MWGDAEQESLLARKNLLATGHLPTYPPVGLFKVGDWLVLEFVSKEDSQVQRLLATREDIFPEYTQEGLERAFAGAFTLVDSQPIQDSQRRLYLFRC